jgi:hypothetical protein
MPSGHNSVGPWTRGFSALHQVQKLYSSSLVWEETPLGKALILIGGNFRLTLDAITDYDQ